MALVGLGDPTGALEHLVQALKLARALDDRKHEAKLLWRAAIATPSLATATRRRQPPKPPSIGSVAWGTPRPAGTRITLQTSGRKRPRRPSRRPP